MKGANGALKIAELARQGLHAIPPTRGARLFPALCQSGEPYLAVLPIDWATFQRARLARNYPIFADIIAAADTTRTTGQAATNTSRSTESIEQVVRRAVGAVLKISPSRLDPRKPLGAMGLTSLMAIELRNMLEGALTRPLSATLAWNHPTIDALVDFLGASASKPILTPVAESGSASDPGGVELAAFSNLSDEEALAALRNVSGAG